jgi:hypothetical protein
VKLKTRLATLLAVLLMTTGATLVVAAPAQAASYSIGQTELNTYCTWVGQVYQAKSIANNVLGWRCYNTYYPNNSNYYTGIDVQLFCDVKHPGTTAKWYTYSNKWDWRCEN